MDERKKMNRRGQTTIFLFIAVVILVLIMLAIIVLGIVSTNVNSALNIDTQIGNVNLSSVNAQTIGKFNTMVVNNADWWGIASIAGMILGLFISAYFVRNSYPKLGIILDLAFIFVTFIVSLYIRAIYSSVVTALSSAGQNFAVNNLTHSNFFILNLPIFVAIIGAVMMILFHSGIPAKSEELNTVPEIITG